MNFISHCNIALPRSLLSARTIGDFSFVKALLKVQGEERGRRGKRTRFLPEAKEEKKQRLVRRDSSEREREKGLATITFLDCTVVKNLRSTSIFIRHRPTEPPRSFVIKIIRLMFRALARKLSIYTYVAVSPQDIMTFRMVHDLKYDLPRALLYF